MENQINSIHWHDAENGECAGLYQTIPGSGDTWIATIEKVCGTEKPVYLLSMQCETTYYGSHDLHADSMEHAKQVASMLLLENATAYCDAYKKKIESLSAITSQLNCSVARFSEADLQFEDYEFNEDCTGLTCQICGAGIEKLMRAFDLSYKEGVWYNFYASYDYKRLESSIIITKNDDESSEEIIPTITAQEKSQVVAALEKYIPQESFGASLYDYIELTHREMLKDSLADDGDFTLLQLPNETKGSLFASYDKQMKSHGEISTVLWDEVYTGHIEFANGFGRIQTAQILEKLFFEFTITHPKDFTGRSMSVSDIIALNVKGTVEFWYCDSIGFTKI